VENSIEEDKGRCKVPTNDPPTPQGRQPRHGIFAGLFSSKECLNRCSFDLTHKGTAFDGNTQEGEWK